MDTIGVMKGNRSTFHPFIDLHNYGYIPTCSLPPHKRKKATSHRHGKSKDIMLYINFELLQINNQAERNETRREMQPYQILISAIYSQNSFKSKENYTIFPVLDERPLLRRHANPA